ncbi:MAG: M50 family metallopeptidase [Proteobacteria bacterium]|nr:M50 family metallopeptidase [Pseudomonadota bacterium]
MVHSPAGTLSEADIVSRARIMLVISVVATILLYTIPQLHIVAYPLLLVSTLVHELGHGVAALLAGGEFARFEMFSDGSGVAYVGGLSRLGHAFSSAGGLVGPAVGAALCFAFARRTSTARYCLAAIGILLLIAELAVVRNVYGWIFVGIFAAICLSIALYGGGQIVQLSLVFLAVQLALSVYSRGDYLFTDKAVTAVGTSTSDSAAIAEAMGFGSYWFWGAVCAAFSVVVLIGGSWYYLRGRSR